MDKITCLVADDSAIYRSQIRRALESLPNIDIVGFAENGEIAIQKVEELKPSLLILDLEMPICDGYEALKRLKAKNESVNVILFASPTERSAEVTFDALKLGARDFVAKPSSFDDSGEKKSPLEKIRDVLKPKIDAIYRRSRRSSPAPVPSSSGEYKSVNWKYFRPDILVIGSSTGGPTALEQLCQKLAPPFSVPIVLTQHMPPVFTKTFADRLGKILKIPTCEAKSDMVLEPNHLYVAPGGYHLQLKGSTAITKTELIDGEEINFIKPAVDPLFTSAAKIFGDSCLGLVLTGMGSDGCEGAKDIKKKKGAILIQKKESCAVWGMPAAVHKAGCYDGQGDLDELALKLNNLISTKMKERKSS